MVIQSLTPLPPTVFSKKKDLVFVRFIYIRVRDTHDQRGFATTWWEPTRFTTLHDLDESKTSPFSRVYLRRPHVWNPRPSILKPRPLLKRYIPHYESSACLVRFLHYLFLPVEFKIPYWKLSRYFFLRPPQRFISHSLVFWYLPCIFCYKTYDIRIYSRKTYEFTILRLTKEEESVLDFLKPETLIEITREPRVFVL